MKEVVIWHGKSSQLVNWKIYSFGTIAMIICLGFYSSLGAIVILGALACVGRMAWAYFEVDSINYWITNQRVVCQAGLLNRTRSIIEMYHVYDIKLVEPLLFRWFGLGTVRVLSTQATSEWAVFIAVPQPRQVQDTIRCIAEKRGVLEDYTLLPQGAALKALN